MLIGTDTELFLRKNGQFVSAHGVIPGSKVNPYPVKKGMVQVDGMAVEFGIDPVKSWPMFKYNINTVLQRMQEMIPDDIEMVIQATATFEKEHMDAQPDEARLLGCDPDYNAYTREENPPPSPASLQRTAGGHLHFGFLDEEKDINDPALMEDCCKVAIQLDYALGLLGLVHDPDRARMRMYGKPGSFRPKPYGIEYRVLSNFWLSSERMMHRVYHNAKAAFSKLDNGMDFETYYIKHNGNNTLTARTIIERGDTMAARHILNDIGVGYEV